MKIRKFNCGLRLFGNYVMQISYHHACFIQKEILLEQKKIKLWNERRYVGNKTDFYAYLNNAVNFILI